MPLGVFLLLVPLVLLQAGLVAFALKDLLDPTRRVRGDNKVLWGLAIAFGSFLGPILYLLVGRKERPAA